MAAAAPASAAEPLASVTTAPIDVPGAAGLSRAAQERAVADYWTPERMAEAIRNGERENGIVAQRSGAAAVAEAGQTLDPVGKILFNYAGGSPSSCTGTVVNTPAETLVITAGHCLYSDGGWHTNIAFVPAYDGDSPLGVFTAWNIAVDSLWSSETDEEHDYGMIITNDNSAGETAADAAGAYDVVVNRGTVNEVTVVGYPAADGYDGLHQEFCTDTTVPTPVPRDMISADCPNVRQGSSGGPWLIDYDATEEIGDIYGVTSISTGRFTATPRFDQRTLDFVVLMDQLAAARP